VADLVAITGALKRKGVALRILSMNLDTGTPTGKLMVGSIAEFERELMLERPLILPLGLGLGDPFPLNRQPAGRRQR
jgi:hypothetical protein